MKDERPRWRIETDARRPWGCTAEYLGRERVTQIAQRWNAYAYAGNDPIRYVDPDGKEYDLSKCDDRFKAGLVRVEGRGGTGKKLLDDFAKVPKKVGGVVKAGAGWELISPTKKSLGFMYAPPTKLEPDEKIWRATGAVSIKLIGGWSEDKYHKVEIFLGTKSLPEGAKVFEGLNDDQFIELFIIHETAHLLGYDEDTADQFARDYLDEFVPPKEKEDKGPRPGERPVDPDVGPWLPQNREDSGL